MNFHLTAIRSVDDHILDFLWIVLKWRVQRKVICFAKCIKNRIGKTLLIRTRLPSHYGNRPFADAQSLIRNHQILVKFHLISKPETLRACAKWIVEREASRLYLIDTDSTVRAGKALTEIHRLPVNNIYNHQPLCQMQYIFNRIRQTLLNSRLHHKSIHDNLYIMLDVLI